MGARYLIDTNAVIELLSDLLPEAGSDWLADIIEQNLHCLSVINEIELLGFRGSEEAMAELRSFIDASPVLPLSREVVQKTIELRQRYRIKLPDPIIAATVLCHELILVTHNTRDFPNIDTLQYIDPHEHQEISDS
jgi:predicted nucleic acid-binding protein